MLCFLLSPLFPFLWNYLHYSTHGFGSILSGLSFIQYKLWIKRIEALVHLMI